MKVTRWSILLSVSAIVVCALLINHYKASESRVQSRGATEPMPALAQVGVWTIDSVDLQLRRQISELYYPGAADEVATLSQFVEALLAAELLARRGTLINDEWLEAEARRIDSETRNPDMLNRIKGLFGNDRRRYLKVFVLPSAAKAKLWTDFRADPQLRQAALQRARDALASWSSGVESWDRILAEQEMIRTRVKVTRGRDIEAIEDEAPAETVAPRTKPKPNRPDTAARSGQAASAPHQVLQITPTPDLAARILDEVLGGLNDGDVAAEILETDEGFQLLRLIRRESRDAALCEVAAAAKPDFTEWFLQQARAVTIKVSDERLLQALKREFVAPDQLVLIGQKQG
jgi:hypothetical protein